MQRSRDWCYTLNNYTEGERDAARLVDCVYHVFGYERGENGTPHLQGYIRFATMKSLKQAKKIFERAHWEPRRGPLKNAIEYCMKEGDFEEKGEKPKTQQEKGEANKNRWRRIIEKAKEGDEAWLEENEPDVYYKGLATFRSHKKPKTQVLGYADEDTPNEWWWGPTGTGKSKRVWEMYPVHYQKEKNKWWCNYTGQETVVIEEADPKSMEHMASFMKIWCDRYPFCGQIKGGRLDGLRPARIIVTSNYPPRDCFTNPDDLEPILRRFKVIHFPFKT